MLSSRLLEPAGVGKEVPVDDVRQVSLEASHRLLVRLARLPVPGKVRLRLRSGPGLDQRDVVEGPVQLAVPTSVETVSVGLTGGCGTVALAEVSSWPSDLLLPDLR